MSQFDSAAQRMLNEMWADLQNQTRNRQYAAAKADPVKHAMTRVMEGGTGYTYFPAGKKSLARKHFTTSICVSRSRNAAGNFLIWRQVDTYSGREIVRNGRLRRKPKWKQAARFDFRYAPGRREALEIARKWAERLLAESVPKQ